MARQKLESRSRPAISSGCSDKSKAYQLLDNESRNLEICKAMALEEREKWDNSLKIENSPS